MSALGRAAMWGCIGIAASGARTERGIVAASSGRGLCVLWEGRTAGGARDKRCAVQPSSACGGLLPVTSPSSTASAGQQRRAACRLARRWCSGAAGGGSWWRGVGARSRWKRPGEFPILLCSSEMCAQHVEPTGTRKTAIPAMGNRIISVHVSLQSHEGHGSSITCVAPLKNLRPPT